MWRVPFGAWWANHGVGRIAPDGRGAGGRWFARSLRRAIPTIRVPPAPFLIAGSGELAVPQRGVGQSPATFAVRRWGRVP